MDFTAKINEIVKKIKEDSSLKDKFLKDPAGTFKSVTGIEIPKEEVDKVVTAVKAKLTADNLSDVAGKVSGLFGKK